MPFFLDYFIKDGRGARCGYIPSSDVHWDYPSPFLAWPDTTVSAFSGLPLMLVVDTFDRPRVFETHRAAGTTILNVQEARNFPGLVFPSRSSIAKGSVWVPMYFYQGSQAVFLL